MTCAICVLTWLQGLNVTAYEEVMADWQAIGMQHCRITTRSSDDTHCS